METKYLTKVIFLNEKNKRLPTTLKTYTYLVDSIEALKIYINFSGENPFPTFHIMNEKDYNYQNASVIFVGIKTIQDENTSSLHELKNIITAGAVELKESEREVLKKLNVQLATDGWYDNIISILLKQLMTNTTSSTVVTSGITSATLQNDTVQQCCTTNTSTTTGGYINAIGTYPYTSTNVWTYSPTLDEISDIKKRVEKLENKNKGEHKMFENLTKNLKCGRAQDVRMSIYGPAFKSEDGNWYAVDSEDVLIDVSDLLFDMDSYCYMMPVAKNQINIGDFILHNGRWVKVLAIEDDAINGALDFFKKEFIVPMPTKSPFGFEFYTKLIPLLDFTKMQANTDTPFGAIPMLMMMNNKNDKDILPMLMMMGTQGGFDFDMSNPMMMYFFMKDGNDNNLLPFLMMGQMNKSNK